MMAARMSSSMCPRSMPCGSSLRRASLIGSKRVSVRDVGFQKRTQTHTSVRDVKMHGLFGLGLPEVAVIAGVAAVVFGPSRLPELGKDLGKTVKSFQKAAKEFQAEISEDDEDAATTTTTTTTTEPKKEEEEGETKP